MSAEETHLPAVLAPPLCPDASFDGEIACAFAVEHLSRPKSAGERGSRAAAGG